VAATGVGAGVLLVGATVRADSNFVTDKILNMTPAEKAALSAIGDIAGATTGVIGAIQAGQSVASFLGLLPGSNTDQAILSQLAAIQQQLNAIPVLIYAESRLQSKFQAQGILAEAQTGYELLQEYVASNNALVPAGSATAVAADNDTLDAVNNVLPVSSNVSTEANPYFLSLYGSASTDGPVTTTLGVKTSAEWKMIDPFRTPQTNGLVFDWREGMPLLLATIQARLSSLAIMQSSVNPSMSILANDASYNGPYGAEIGSYVDALGSRLADIETQTHCRESIWAVGTVPGHYDYKWYCTDVSSGITGKVETSGYINYPGNDPNWNCAGAICNLGGPVMYSPTSNMTCLNVHWRNNVCERPTWGTTHIVNATSKSTANYDADVVTAFREYAPSTPGFADMVANGHQDAYVNLLTELGVFQVQRQLDTAENIWQNIPQPATNYEIKQWSTGLCIDLDPTWVGAETLATGQSQMIAGYPFILADCNNHTTNWSWGWYWDPNSGGIFNVAYYLFAGQAWCIAASSTRANTPIVTAPCDGSPQERWTWDSGTGLFKNEYAAMAPLQANGTGIGAPLAVGSPNLDQGYIAAASFGGL
jgi:hypothetical protein